MRAWISSKAREPANCPGQMCTTRCVTWRFCINPNHSWISWVSVRRDKESAVHSLICRCLGSYQRGSCQFAPCAGDRAFTSAFRFIDALFLRSLPVAHGDCLYALFRPRPDDLGVLRTFEGYSMFLFEIGPTRQSWMCIVEENFHLFNVGKVQSLCQTQVSRIGSQGIHHRVGNQIANAVSSIKGFLQPVEGFVLLAKLAID